MTAKTIAMISVVAVVALVGGAVLMFAKSVPEAPEIDMPDDLVLPVVDPYDTTVPQEVVDNAAQSNPSIKDMTLEQVRDRIKELFESQGYQQKVDKLADQTNSKLDSVVQKLDQSYDELNNYVATQCSNVSEQSITLGNMITHVDIYTRDGDDSFVVYCVKTLQQIDAIQQYQGEQFMAGMIEKFPNTCALYEKTGVELSVENILHIPDEISRSALRDADYKDAAFNGGLTRGHYVEGRYSTLTNSYTIEKQFDRYLERFVEQLTPEQAAGFEKVLNNSNNTYDQYVSIVENYNQAIRDLQQDFLENLSIEEIVKDLSANVILSCCTDLGGMNLGKNEYAEV